MPLRGHLRDAVEQRAQTGDDDEINPEAGAGGGFGSDGANEHAGSL